MFLEGERIDPPQIKGLLNREARAREAYEAARRRLLGVAEPEPGPPMGEANPFR